MQRPCRPRYKKVYFIFSYSGYQISGYRKSNSIQLTSGNRYYLEMKGEEFNGADYFMVAMQLPNKTIIYPITANYLARYE